MSYAVRIIVDLLLLISLLIFPWWVGTVVALLGILLFPFFIEALIFFFLLDAFFGAPIALGIPYVYLLSGTILYVVIVLTKRTLVRIL